MQEDNTVQETHSPPKQQTKRLFVDLFACVIIPTLILKKLSTEEFLGSHWALLAALSLPLLIGLYDFIQKKKVSFIPALGFISILLTGSIALLKLPTAYIAIKEALIPFIIAIATLVSTKTRHPLVKTFLYNDLILNTRKVSEQLKRHNKENEFQTVMQNATYLLAMSFIVSAVLNYVLAKWIVVSPSGTETFNDELGTMTLLSYPVILLPCMVITIFTLTYVIRKIGELTHLTFEELLNQ